MSLEAKKDYIEADSTVSIRKQSVLLQLNRSSLYYDPEPISTCDLKLMHRIDEIHTKSPCYGRRPMHAQLLRDGFCVGERHVGSLMRTMGIEAIYPHPDTSRNGPGHAVYPYLLKHITAAYPNHIWSIDITYIRLSHGFMYLCAILDWYSRLVLAWRCYERMDVSLTVDTLMEALERYKKPLIHNSDQGSQMTASEYIAILEGREIAISMDHRGRCFDNIFTERLCRTVKYEEVYLKEYDSPREARSNLEAYFTYYNDERLHASLDYATPREIYTNR